MGDIGVSPSATRVHFDLSRVKKAGDLYTGTCSIEWWVDNACSTLYYDCDDTCVTVTSLKVTSGPKRSVKIASNQLAAPGSDRHIVTLASDLSCGMWALEMAFKASVRKDLVALHVAYTNPKTNGIVLATQFEVREARKAFPCIDEPRFRLPYTVSIAKPSTCQWVLSNTVPSEEKGTTVTFTTTTPLPSYVVGFILSTDSDPNCTKRDEICIPRTLDEADDSTLVVRVTAVGDRAAAFDVAATLADARRGYALMLEMFKTALPHDVINIVALPNTHISGMENDGLIVLNAKLGCLSAVPAGKARSQAQDVLCGFVAHEIAHHWVGNMVGIGFALKEGVCLILEQFAIFHANGKPIKEFLSSPLFQVGTLSSAVTDSGASAEDGKELTDKTYQNAELAMKHHVATVGWEGFTAGLARLVEEHAGTYVTDDVFFSLANTTT